MNTRAVWIAVVTLSVFLLAACTKMVRIEQPEKYTRPNSPQLETNPSLSPRPDYIVKLHSRADHTKFEAFLDSDSNPLPDIWYNWDGQNRTMRIRPRLIFRSDGPFPSHRDTHKLHVEVAGSAGTPFAQRSDTVYFKPPALRFSIPFKPKFCAGTIGTVTGNPPVWLGSNSCPRLSLKKTAQRAHTQTAVITASIPAAINRDLTIRLQPSNSSIELLSGNLQIHAGLGAPLDVTISMGTLDNTFRVWANGLGNPNITASTQGYQENKIEVSIRP